MFLSQLLPTPTPQAQPIRPHRLQITLSDPAELQVSQGQVVQLGDILVVRSAERIQLETRRLEIQSQLLALENTPPPDTSVLQERILSYQQAQTIYDQHYRLITHLQASEVAPSLMRQEILRLQSLYSELLNVHTQSGPRNATPTPAGHQQLSPGADHPTPSSNGPASSHQS
ncbi:MAG: hypothetical protein HC924_01355 [Synechococcaceae cyanobacterium SM2_3_2]|nr:hypothetical protein [Synechococcaceae cyanobacterium SM2_3_2]